MARPARKPHVLVFTAVVLCVSCVSCQLQPRADTENGPVVGRLRLSHKGRTYRSYEGVPYAKPPVGDLRFKEAQILEKKWIGEWNATSPGSICLQFDHITNSYDNQGQITYTTRGDEDCLFLNIYTPDTGKINKDVLVWIHGGAFMFGSPNLYGPDYLMDHDDVVFITVGYRLGPLGFLSTGDAVIPGNNGLKDQTAALSWIQRNIAGFGGDPVKVTLLGNSAGGASVHYHYLSTMSNGLFNRGISYSGTALCPWALVTDAPQKTKKLASILGCPTSDTRSILKCLRRRPARQIVSAMKHFFTWLYNPFTVFGPVVEVASERPFIDKSPEEIIRQGLSKDLPWITGVTSDEGLYPGADFVGNKTLLAELNSSWDAIAPSLLFYNASQPVRRHRDIARQLLKAYFGDKSISLDTTDELVQLIGDRLFVVPAVRGAVLQAQHNVQSVYAYVFRYQGPISISNVITKTNTIFGVCHCDDIFLFVKFGGIDTHITDNNVKMADLQMDVIINFAKTGKVPKHLGWEPVPTSATKPFTYLNIKAVDDVQVVQDSRLGKVDLFEDIFHADSLSKDEL